MVDAGTVWRHPVGTRRLEYVATIEGREFGAIRTNESGHAYLHPLAEIPAIIARDEALAGKGAGQ